MEEEVIITEECVEENPEENQEETNAIQKTEDTEQEKNEPDEENELLQEINAKVDHLTQLFTKKIQHTAHEEKIVDQMHAELQKYKDDMYSQLVRPILLDMIEVRDSILRMSNVYAEKPEEEQSIPLRVFRDYSYDIQDILEKNNISIYFSEEGDEFNPIKQRALKKVKTPVEELHGKIAESMSSGYEYLGKPISPENVSVYVYEKPSDVEGEKE